MFIKYKSKIVNLDKITHMSLQANRLYVYLGEVCVIFKFKDALEVDSVFKIIVMARELMESHNENSLDLEGSVELFKDILQDKVTTDEGE